MDNSFEKKFDKLIKFIKKDIKDNDSAFEIAERCIGYAILIDDIGYAATKNINIEALQYSDLAIGNKYNKYLMKWLMLNPK